MKKILTALIAIALSMTAPAAQADVAPQADVSCSLSSTGVSYGISMVFSGGSISFNNLSYQWDYMIAPGGANPQLISNYGARTSFKTTAGNALDLTYEEMLALANNNTSATVLIYANSIFASGPSTITNSTGKGCYVDLPTVLSNKLQAGAQKAAADKAAADAAAKAATDAAIAAEAAANQALAVTRVRVESAFQVLLQRNGEIDNLVQSTISKYPSTKGNLTKMLLSRPQIPMMLTDSLTLESMQESLRVLDAFKLNLNTFIATMIKNAPKTITCVKGKTVKKVTAVKPKCPAGFKAK